jgi:hypothetical protein
VAREDVAEEERGEQGGSTVEQMCIGHQICYSWSMLLKKLFWSVLSGSSASYSALLRFLHLYRDVCKKKINSLSEYLDCIWHALILVAQQWFTYQVSENKT